MNAISAETPMGVGPVSIPVDRTAEQSDEARLPASFRDPSGFIFRDASGGLLRQVNRSYKTDYDHLMETGLYADLVEQGQLVEHKQLDLSRRCSEDAAYVLQPRLIPFISYPYEWCFGQIRDAALLTLDVEQRALERGMTLKDASAYNVQFDGSRPVLIDTLSLRRYEEGSPWAAYRQFCQHFVAPLAMMAHTDVRLSRQMVTHLDGIPLDLAIGQLPWWLRMRPGLAIHLYLHCRSQRKFQNTVDESLADGDRTAHGLRVSRNARLGLLDSLRRTVQSLRYNPASTPWSDYYENNSYSRTAEDHKQEVVRQLLRIAQPRTVWDLGANNGRFSRLAAEYGALTISMDMDPGCVELNYRECRRTNEPRILPLCIDLSNPSPSIGWAHAERQSLIERGPADLAMGLALIHHLAISNNVPLPMIARWMSTLGRWAIMEWVPKSDPQVARLLRSREDIFDAYSESDFRSSMERYFKIRDEQLVGEDGRRIYLLEARCRAS